MSKSPIVYISPAILTKYGWAVDAFVRVRVVKGLGVRRSDIENLQINQRELVDAKMNKIFSDMRGFARTHDPREKLFFAEPKHVALELTQDEFASVTSRHATLEGISEIISNILESDDREKATADGQHSFGAYGKAAEIDSRWDDAVVRVTFYLNLKEEDLSLLFVHLNNKRSAPNNDTIDAGLASRLKNGLEVDETDLARAKYALSAHQLATGDKGVLNEYVRLPFTKKKAPRSGIKLHAMTVGIKMAANAAGINILELSESERVNMLRKCWHALRDSLQNELFDADKDFETFTNVGHSTMFTVLTAGALAAEKRWPGISRTNLTLKAGPIFREFVTKDPRCAGRDNLAQVGPFKDVGGSKDRARLMGDFVRFVHWVRNTETPSYEEALKEGIITYRGEKLDASEDTEV